MYFAIVDDLAPDRERLKRLVWEDCSANGIDAEFLLYDSGEAFLKEYRTGLFSAVFLDVLMGGMTGIEVARKIRETEERLPIIITTTEPDLAVEGFAVHVMDFLVKPIEQKKAAWCMRELREYAAIPAYVEVREISSRSSSLPSLIALDDILYAQSDKHNVVIHTVSGDVRIRSSFQEFLSLLPKNGRFFECGRGVAVNFSWAKSIGDGMVLMKNGERLLFSQRQQSAVQQAFLDHTFSRTRKGGWA